jgi:hypothetical protein
MEYKKFKRREMQGHRNHIFLLGCDSAPSQISFSIREHRDLQHYNSANTDNLSRRDNVKVILSDVIFCSARIEVIYMKELYTKIQEKQCGYFESGKKRKRIQCIGKTSAKIQSTSWYNGWIKS